MDVPPGIGAAGTFLIGAPSFRAASTLGRALGVASVAGGGALTLKPSHRGLERL
jgi:hypothetical protein